MHCEAVFCSKGYKPAEIWLNVTGTAAYRLFKGKSRTTQLMKASCIILLYRYIYMYIYKYKFKEANLIWRENKWGKLKTLTELRD